MKTPLACVLVGFAVCVFGAAPPRASADAAVTSAVGQVTKLTSQAGVLLFNPVPHTKVDNQAGPTSANVTTYDESVSSHQDDPGGPSVLSSTGGNINQPNVIIGNMTSDSSAHQHSEVSAAPASVAVASSATASVRKTNVVPNCCFGTLGSALTSFQLDVVIAKRCSYHLDGSLTAASDDPTRAGIFVQLSLTGDDGGPFGGFGALASPHDAPTVPLSHSGVFEPGPISLSVTLLCDLGSVDSNGRLSGFGGSQGNAAWNLSFVLSPVDDGDVIRWTDRQGGAYGATTNWNPPTVPTDDQVSVHDTALFALPGSYTVDFARSGIAAQRLAALQRVRRLVVHDGRPSFANANLVADSPSEAEPSVAVGPGAELTLQSGTIQSQHAVIGDTRGGFHDGGQVFVLGADARWENAQTMHVGRASGAFFFISSGGFVSSVTTHLNSGVRDDGVSVTVDGVGSKWVTGKFDANGGRGVLGGTRVTVNRGAAMTSDDVFLDAQVNAATDVTVTGSDLGVPSSWTAQSCSIGLGGAGDSSVSVAEGGALTVAGDVEVGLAGGRGILSVAGRTPDAPIHFSNVGCASMNVGFQGADGHLEISDGAAVNVAGDMFVGRRGGGGTVLVSGKNADGTASGLSVAGNLTFGAEPRHSGGRMNVENGALVTSGPAVVGVVGEGTGTVEIEGIGSLWHVKGDLSIALGSVDLFGGTLSVDGDIHQQDRIGGTGRIVVGGVLRADGYIGPGHSPGTLTIEGDLVQGPDGVLDAEVAGTGPGQADQLVVTGSATLGGTLVLQFMNGFAPHAGEHFDVLHVDGTVTGDYAAVQVQGLAPGAQFDFAKSGASFTATATIDAVALPTVSVKASAKQLLEKQAKKKKATLTFSRKGDASQPLTVTYTLGGTATNGLDYVSLPGVVTIPAKKKSAKVTVQLVDDPFHEGTETIDVAVVPGVDYTHSLASKAEISIVDND